jgi:hypothetical protein
VNDESVIAGPNRHGVAVVVPAFPAPCDYFRVVRITYHGDKDALVKAKEIAYWESQEWRSEDADLSCIGAIAGAIKAVHDGSAFDDPAFRAHEDVVEWEDWT